LGIAGVGAPEPDLPKVSEESGPETLSFGLVAFDVRQTGYAVTLQAAVQR